MVAETGRKVIQEVVLKHGPQRAARLLGITEGVLDRLISGKNDVPDSLLLKALDLLTDDDSLRA